MIAKMSSLVAVAQMRSSSSKCANIAICTRLIAKAKNAGAKAIFLPEAFDYIAENREKSMEMAENIEGATISHFCKLARDQGIILSLGGFHQRCRNEEKISNTHLIISEQGDIIGQYDKTHLYDVTLSSGKLNLQESSYVRAGAAIVSPISTSIGKIGLAICYDLRFPELSGLQKLAGAQILTFPSAFTIPTGKAHWQTLLRARAIENQCYVIAAAQIGRHNEKRESYGHSLIVDPWGKVLVDLEEKEEEIGLAQIDLELVQKTRDNMNVEKHRRNDLYILSNTDTRQHLDPNASFVFGAHSIPGDHVIFCTAHSFCFVNRKPVLPGHLLVSARRKSAHRMQDLSSGEIFDIFQAVKRAEAIAEKFRNSSASTISVQDGAEAGQTISQFHVHVLARKGEDFGGNNDDVYDELQKHDKDESGLRSSEIMAEEAKIMRRIMEQLDFKD